MYQLCMSRVICVKIENATFPFWQANVCIFNKNDKRFVQYLTNF